MGEKKDLHNIWAIKQRFMDIVFDFSLHTDSYPFSIVSPSCTTSCPHLSLQPQFELCGMKVKLSAVPL